MAVPGGALDFPHPTSPPLIPPPHPALEQEEEADCVPQSRPIGRHNSHNKVAARWSALPSGGACVVSLPELAV
jgi:hypothetical protein